MNSIVYEWQEIYAPIKASDSVLVLCLVSCGCRHVRTSRSREAIIIVSRRREKSTELVSGMSVSASERERRLAEFNARQSAASSERKEHRQYCLQTALVSGLTAGACGSGLALSAMLLRPSLVRNSSMRSFVVVITFFIPFSLSMQRFPSAHSTPAAHLMPATEAVVALQLTRSCLPLALRLRAFSHQLTRSRAARAKGRAAGDGQAHVAGVAALWDEHAFSINRGDAAFERVRSAARTVSPQKKMQSLYSTLT